MDALGASGNGLAWYAPDNSAITDHAIYQSLATTSIASQDAATIKAIIGASMPSAEGSPIINYLYWLLTMVEAVA